MGNCCKRRKNKTSVKKKQYTFEEVAKHNKEKDVWMVLDNVVYDFTEY